MSDLDIVIEMIEKKEGLSRSGTPKVSALEAKLGRDIDASERDELYAMAQVEIESRSKSKKVVEPKPQPVRSRVVTSGMGGW